MDLSRAAAEQQRRDDAAADMHSAAPGTAPAGPDDMPYDLPGALHEGHHTASMLEAVAEDEYVGAAAAVAAAMAQPGWPADDHTAAVDASQHDAAGNGLTPMAAAAAAAAMPFASPQLPGTATVAAVDHHDDIADANMLAALVDDDHHTMLAVLDEPVATAVAPVETATPRMEVAAPAAAAATNIHAAECAAAAAGAGDAAANAAAGVPAAAAAVGACVCGDGGRGETGELDKRQASADMCRQHKGRLLSTTKLYNSPHVVQAYPQPARMLDGGF